MSTVGKSGGVATPASLAGKEQGAQEKPLCFVISQIGAENSPEREGADKVLRHVIEKPLGSRYRVERADEIGKPGLITVQVIQRLASAELVVADLTGGNPNVYYELALRHYFAKPVVHIIQRGQKAPFDVSPMRYVEFDLGDPDALDTAREELLSHVVAMEKGEKVVTLVQVAEVFAEAAGEKGDETHEMLAAIYDTLGNLQEHVSRVGRAIVDDLRRPSLFGGPLGIGNRASVPMGNFAAWLEPDAAAPRAHLSGRLSDLASVRPTSMAAGATVVGADPNILTPGSPGHVPVPQPRPVASPMDEQAKEEQQKREQHSVHPPSLKRGGEQGKTGGEKK